MIGEKIHKAFNEHVKELGNEDNIFIPLATRIQDYQHFWSQDGNFNLQLYLKVCQIKKMNNE